MWYVYVIKGINSGHYIGCSNNFQRRLSEHNHGYSLATKNNIPWILVHLEEFNNQKDAYFREKQIKSYKGGSAFKKLLNIK